VRYGYNWDRAVAEEVWNTLAEVAKKWYDRNKDNFDAVVAFACPESGYRAVLRLVQVDRYVPETCPDIEVRYEENVSRVYTQPGVWKKLETAVMEVM
jgi:hypothetical protein